MFSAADLTGMRAAQVAHMMDTCVFQANVQTKSADGQNVDTWPVDSGDVVCGLEMKSGSERHGTEMVLLEYDAMIRLPIASNPNVRDRIKVTKRFNEDIADLVFDIVGPIQRGPSGIRLLLKRIET